MKQQVIVVSTISISQSKVIEQQLKSQLNQSNIKTVSSFQGAERLTLKDSDLSNSDNLLLEIIRDYIFSDRFNLHKELNTNVTFVFSPLVNNEAKDEYLTNRMYFGNELGFDNYSQGQINDMSNRFKSQLKEVCLLFGLHKFESKSKDIQIYQNLDLNEISQQISVVPPENQYLSIIINSRQKLSIRFHQKYAVRYIKDILSQEINKAQKQNRLDRNLIYKNSRKLFVKTNDYKMPTSILETQRDTENPHKTWYKCRSNFFLKYFRLVPSKDDILTEHWSLKLADAEYLAALETIHLLYQTQIIDQHLSLNYDILNGPSQFQQDETMIMISQEQSELKNNGNNNYFIQIKQDKMQPQQQGEMKELKFCLEDKIRQLIKEFKSLTFHCMILNRMHKSDTTFALTYCITINSHQEETAYSFLNQEQRLDHLNQVLNNQLIKTPKNESKPIVLLVPLKMEKLLDDRDPVYIYQKLVAFHLYTLYLMNNCLTEFYNRILSGKFSYVFDCCGTEKNIFKFLIWLKNNDKQSQAYFDFVFKYKDQQNQQPQDDIIKEQIININLHNMIIPITIDYTGLSQPSYNIDYRIIDETIRIIKNDILHLLNYRRNINWVTRDQSKTYRFLDLQVEKNKLDIDNERVYFNPFIAGYITIAQSNMNQSKSNLDNRMIKLQDKFYNLQEFYLVSCKIMVKPEINQRIIKFRKANICDAQQYLSDVKEEFKKSLQSDSFVSSIIIDKKEEILRDILSQYLVSTAMSSKDYRELSTLKALFYVNGQANRELTFFDDIVVPLFERTYEQQKVPQQDYLKIKEIKFDEALTAPCVNNNDNYERLELLGDSALNFLTLFELCILNKDESNKIIDDAKTLKISNKNLFEKALDIKIYNYLAVNKQLNLNEMLKVQKLEYKSAATSMPAFVDANDYDNIITRKDHRESEAKITFYQQQLFEIRKIIKETEEDFDILQHNLLTLLKQSQIIARCILWRRDLTELFMKYQEGDYKNIIPKSQLDTNDFQEFLQKFKLSDKQIQWYKIIRENKQWTEDDTNLLKNKQLIRIAQESKEIEKHPKMRILFFLGFQEYMIISSIQKLKEKLKPKRKKDDKQQQNQYIQDLIPQENQTDKKIDPKKITLKKLLADIMEALTGAFSLMSLQMASRFLQGIGIMNNTFSELENFKDPEIDYFDNELQVKKENDINMFCSEIFKRIPKKDELNPIQRMKQITGYQFTDRFIALKSLINSTYLDSEEYKSFLEKFKISSIQSSLIGDCERLEYLGDAILGYIVTDQLYRNTEHDKQFYVPKKLHLMKQNIISNVMLTHIAIESGLIDLLIYDKGSLGNNGIEKNIEDIKSIMTEKECSIDYCIERYNLIKQMKRENDLLPQNTVQEQQIKEQKVKDYQISFEQLKDQIHHIHDVIYENNNKIFGDLVEAVIGAIFMDSRNFDLTREIVMNNILGKYFPIYTDFDYIQDNPRTSTLELWNSKEYLRQFKLSHMSIQGQHHIVIVALIGDLKLFKKRIKNNVKNKHRVFYKVFHDFVKGFIKVMEDNFEKNRLKIESPDVTKQIKIFRDQFVVPN